MRSEHISIHHKEELLISIDSTFLTIRLCAKNRTDKQGKGNTHLIWFMYRLIIQVLHEGCKHEKVHPIVWERKPQIEHSFNPTFEIHSADVTLVERRILRSTRASTRSL